MKMQVEIEAGYISCPYDKSTDKTTTVRLAKECKGCEYFFGTSYKAIACTFGEE
jgi:hypothetical protein